MTPWVSKLIPRKDIVLFEKIKEIVNNFPDIDYGVDKNGKKIVLSCHMLARAIAITFSLECRDGYFYPNYQHSWLKTAKKNIIDVYPVGIISGPILISGDDCSPARWLYKEKQGDFIDEIINRIGIECFEKAVDKIIKRIEKKAG